VLSGLRQFILILTHLSLSCFVFWIAMSRDVVGRKSVLSALIPVGSSQMSAGLFLFIGGNAVFGLGLTFGVFLDVADEHNKCPI
jgi:hypothetical protein